MEIYICRRGDNLHSLSRRFNISAEKLMKANGLESERLTPGLSLFIPSECQEPKKEIELCTEIRNNIPANERKELLNKLCFAVSLSAYLSPDGGLTMESSPKSCIDEALSYGTVPLLGLYNLCPQGSYSGELAHFAIKDEQSRERLCRLIISAISESGAKGLYLEFCCLFPFDTENYCCFIEKCSALCHQNGFYFLCSLVPPEFDPLSLEAVRCAGKCADRIVLLAYDYSGILNPPGAIAPLSRVRATIESALETVCHKKLLLCLSGTGLDWSLPWRYGTAASPLSNRRAQNLATAMGSEIKFMPHEFFPSFSYIDLAGIKHRVCYEDVRSLNAKFRLCDEYALAGLWLKRRDRGFPPSEELIDSLYSYKKYI